jgi:hypothetical protein
MNNSHFSKWHEYGPWGKGLRIAGITLLGVIGAAIFALIFGWFVMILWNWLMPAIFHLGTINFWQAFGIIILAKLIFGGNGFGDRHGHGGKHGPWKHRRPEEHSEEKKVEEPAAGEA